MSGPHDLGYKYLFAHPELVRELVLGFTPLQWRGDIDVTAFDRVNPGYVSERFSERHDDIVWRVRLGDQWLYVYILLEFQSRVDRWMALRMQVYIGLLYQDLVKRGELGPQSMLPPVLPLVFYNGAERWSASMELAESVAPTPDALRQFQAGQRYFLIDQKRLDLTLLAQQDTVLSILFRLELSEFPDVIADLAPVLRAWLLEDEQAPLRRSVAAWVEQLLLREEQGDELIGALLQTEGAAMGTRKFETWTEALLDRGLQQGIQQGIQQGLQQGLQQGIEQGIECQVATLRSILEKILVRRFKAIPPGTSARIAAASVEQAQEWIDRALEVDSIETLFGPEPRRAPLPAQQDLT